MRKYKVNLTRSYVVTIEAEDKQKARRYAEFYIGNCYDLSTFEDRQKDNFLIEEIGSTINEAMGIEMLQE